MERKRCIMLAKRVVGVLIFFSGVSIFWVQEKQKPKERSLLAAVAQTTKTQCSHTYKITPEDTARPNPVRFTEASVVRGRRTYFYQCAMCHGEKGDGKGEVALMPTSCRSTMPNFTKADALKDWSDGDLFAILGQGSDTMPGMEKILEEKQRWDLINFLRATGGRMPEESTGPQTE
jgi:mono/diheme cytochrome c family protein